MESGTHPSNFASEAFLASIVDSSDDAIFSKDLDGVITSWNRGAERLFGYTAAEVIGQPVLILFPPDRVNEEPAILDRIRRGERVAHYETVRQAKSGRLIDVSLSISPIRDRDGRVIGAAKIARDITAQKAAERALREAQAQLAAHASQLEASVRERTAELQQMAGEAQAFSYSLSHDIRAPLRAISGFADILLTDFGDRIPEGVDYLQRIARAAHRMDRLLSDVLSFSKISRQELVLEPVALEPLIQDIIGEREELQPHASEITIAGPLAPVQGNSPSLTQCLANLLENAVKFVAPGVRPEVKVYTVMEDRTVRVCVQDNGIGIDPEGQARLFKIFERLHPQKRYEGTGLGLAIVLRAAERMGGTAGVTSTPGAGSTFWIELPKAADS